MRKFDYLLGSILIASFGFNFYLIMNMDRYLEKEYIPEIHLTKEISQKSDINVRVSSIQPKIDISKYKISSGREDPFKPLVNINIPEEQELSKNNISSIKQIINKEKEEIFPFEVRGILKGEKSRIIILEKDDKSYVVEEGKEVEGYKILSIDFEKEVVTFQKGSKKYNISLVSKR